MPTTVDRDRMGLPIRPFLYTLDQLATLLAVTLDDLSSKLIYFEKRSTGIRRRDEIAAINISKPDQSPEWRVSEIEFIRWLKFKGFRIYERNSIRQ